MSSTDLIVYGMCAGMILIGIIVIRLSHRDRGTGAIAIVLGVVGLVAWLSAEEGAPPLANATPTAVTTASPASSTPVSLHTEI